MSTKCIELFHQDGRSSGVFYCSECRIVYKTQKEAEECHGERLCDCGAKIEQRYSRACHTCETRRCNEADTKRENERFEKAAKIQPNEYEGTAVYVHDRYFPTLEDALDYLEEDELSTGYIWACKDIGLRQAEVSDITEPILSNAWEDADENDLNGVDELAAAIARFNEANKSAPVWEVDYSTAILLSSPAVPVTNLTTEADTARKD